MFFFVKCLHALFQKCCGDLRAVCVSPTTTTVSTTSATTNSPSVSNSLKTVPTTTITHKSQCTELCSVDCFKQFYLSIHHYLSIGLQPVRCEFGGLVFCVRRQAFTTCLNHTQWFTSSLTAGLDLFQTRQLFERCAQLFLITRCCLFSTFVTDFVPIRTLFIVISIFT